MDGKYKWVGESGTAVRRKWRRNRRSTALDRLWSVCTLTCHLDHCQLLNRAQASDERVQLKASTGNPGGGGERRRKRNVKPVCRQGSHTHTHTHSAHLNRWAKRLVFCLGPHCCQDRSEDLRCETFGLVS